MGGQMSDPGAGSGTAVRIWDLPTRLFHWTLVLLIVLLYASGEYDLLDMRWHFWAGYAALALVLFRVLWGFAGSQTSRFSDFVRGPSAVFAYVRGLRSGAHAGIGHNPLGGWSVLALLLSVLVQTVSGLFASDDLDNDGPFAASVSTYAVKWMTRVHNWNQNVLLALIGLHVGAVLVYLLVRHDNLIAPMLSGRRRVAHAPALRFASVWLALALFVLCAAAVAALIWLAG
jgi:cytochrome b